MRNFLENFTLFTRRGAEIALIIDNSNIDQYRQFYGLNNDKNYYYSCDNKQKTAKQLIRSHWEVS